MGHPRFYSWLAFLLVAQSKLRAIELGELANKPASIIIATHFGFHEEVFGRTTSFDLTWNLATSWATILRASGLWTPVTGTTWAAYKTSMTDVGHNWQERGTAGLKHTVADDHLHDVCELPVPMSVGQIVERAQNSQQYQLFRPQCPRPESSWLAFQNSVTDVRKTNTVAHYPLVAPETYIPPDQSPNDPDYQNPGGQTREPIVQRRSDGKYEVIMRGWAMRAGYKVPRFELKEFGGSPVKPVDPQKWIARELGHYTCPVHSAAWEIKYIVLRTPKDNSYKIEAKKFQ